MLKQVNFYLKPKQLRKLPLFHLSKKHIDIPNEKKIDYRKHHFFNLDNYIKKRKIDKMLYKLVDRDNLMEDDVLEEMQSNGTAEIIQTLDEYFQTKNLSEKRRELLLITTGAKNEDLQNILDYLPLEKFHKIKEGIVKVHPELQKFDFDYQMKNLSDINDRVDFIVDNYFLNKEEDFINFFELEVAYQNKEERSVVLIRRSTEKVKQLRSYFEKFESDLNEQRHKNKYEEIKKIVEKYKNDNPNKKPLNANDLALDSDLDEFMKYKKGVYKIFDNKETEFSLTF